MPRYAFVPFTRQRTKGGVFEFRFQLPEGVFTALAATSVEAKRTITFSLKTRDPLVARSRALRAAADVGEMIAALQSGATVSNWRLEPALYQREGIVGTNAAKTGTGTPPARRRDARAKTNILTMRRVYEEVYLPRRQERKGAPPRRRSRLDIEKAIKRFSAFAGSKAVTEITRQEAERFVRGLDVGSVATVKKTVTCLSSICNAA